MSETPTLETADTGRSAWQRSVIDPIAAQLTQGITPEKIALTLAAGSSFALFPILGTTTLLCLMIGVLLKLNQPIIQIINALCTPIHIPFILVMVRFGGWLFNEKSTHMGIRMMNHMLWEDPREFLEKFGITALHAVAGWALIMPFWAILVYVVALPVLREALRRKVVIVTSSDSTPPIHPVP
ncbi:MAG TPA: DUF2062 domain-containing protein [Opitutaceae bacterium]